MFSKNTSSITKEKKKLSPKIFDATFIGYVGNSAAYRFRIIKSKNSIVNSIIEIKNADFFEDIFPWKTNGQQ